MKIAGLNINSIFWGEKGGKENYFGVVLGGVRVCVWCA